MDRSAIPLDAPGGEEVEAAPDHRRPARPERACERRVPLHVTSEIGRLKAVVLHRPGAEIENLTPELMPRLLFDDIPYLPPMQEEHDYFATVLRNRGVEVLYIEKLAAEALADPRVREAFVDRLLEESQENVYDS